MEYPTRDSAENARILIDGFVLDKNHTFSAYSFSSLKNLEKPAEKLHVEEKRKYNDVVSLLFILLSFRFIVLT